MTTFYDKSAQWTSKSMKNRQLTTRSKNPQWRAQNLREPATTLDFRHFLGQERSKSRVK
jgi:hypothetical protein